MHTLQRRVMQLTAEREPIMMSLESDCIHDLQAT